MSGAFVACLTFAAHGSANVFDDAVFWFRGGKDKSNDRYMRQTGEFFDDLHANDTSHENHQMEVQSYTSPAIADGFKSNAVFRMEKVIYPALGTQKNTPVLHLSNNAIPYNGKDYFWPQYVKPYGIFARNNISNEYTVVSRLRLDEDGRKQTQCLMRIGYSSSAKKGLLFGFAPVSPGLTNKYITAFCTPNESASNTQVTFNSISIPTNTWVDVAVVVGNGKLRVGVATPRTSDFHGSNPTIAFAETNMWTANCTLPNASNESYYRLFCQTGQTSQQLSSGADKTCFTGSIQQMAIWGRALSDQEVMAAFGMPRPTIFRTGFDNGSSNEFGGTRSGSTQTIDGLGSWQNIANVMKAGDTWTVNFNALRDEDGLSQIFSIKSLSGSAAQIEPTLNGISLGEGRIAANSHAFWPVATNIVRAGANELVIRRKDGGARDFLMDSMELGGSLGVGKMTASSEDDERVSPGLIATGVPSAADPNTQHWPTELKPSTGVTNLHFRVWIDPDVADRASFTLKTATCCHDASSGDLFEIYINEVNKSKLKAADGWQQQKLPIEPSDLHGGWNDFEFISTQYPNTYWEFGYFRFETVLSAPFGFSPPPGMTVFIK